MLVAPIAKYQKEKPMPYCKALYNHLFVDVQGFYAPCCVFKEKTKINHKDMSWIDFYNSSYMNNIRNNMKNGWDPGCSNCKNLEDQKLPSYRQIVDIYCKSNEPRIEYIEISCSNQCNIRCRMCGAISSSKWAKTLNLETTHIEDLKSFLSQIDTTHLKVVKYLGGEPFITKEIKILFEWMLSLPNKVKFYCNTNLTLFPKKYIDILKSFESIIIGYSIDGTELVNDYIRQDSNWKNTQENLDLWEDLKNTCNIYSYVHTTVQAYNFHDIKNIKEIVCKKYNLHHSTFKLTSPVELSLNALPVDYVNMYTDDYNVKFLKDYKYDPILYEKLKQKTISQDNILQNYIKDYIPELAKCL